MLPRLFTLPVLALASSSLITQTATSPAVASPAASATSAPTFTVADVHPAPWVNFPFANGGSLHGDRYTLRQATMVDLISNAYGIDASRVSGGPSWLELDRFEVVAQAAPGTPPATLKLMLRSLLA